MTKERKVFYKCLIVVFFSVQGFDLTSFVTDFAEMRDTVRKQEKRILQLEAKIALLDKAAEAEMLADDNDNNDDDDDNAELV